ncbi:hypothetical protein RvY_07702 [Ramazzottius varieornatus]|uniref:Uncharacterized protein n=1 Tax=Ramazzottius varieornatus TaxID=947166 RepID=A0A1D1VCK4_RAMVA|nr:hypothetical protein RvY_07702 [Ramazzottius varieornatus]
MKCSIENQQTSKTKSGRKTGTTLGTAEEKQLSNTVNFNFNFKIENAVQKFKIPKHFSAVRTNMHLRALLYAFRFHSSTSRVVVTPVSPASSSKQLIHTDLDRISGPKLISHVVLAIGTQSSLLVPSVVPWKSRRITGLLNSGGLLPRTVAVS